MIHNNKKLVFLTLVQLSFYSFFCQAASDPVVKSHPFYVGVSGGYGSTTWVGLVPSEENQNFAMRTSTPISADEGGGLWGFFAGYEWKSKVAFELSYMQYPKATIRFDPEWFFSEDHPDLTEFSTNTETISLVGKIFLQIPHTALKFYSSVGGAALHRQDIILNDWRWTPTFGGGLNYDINPRLFTEIGANYTAGYGEARLNPTDGYFPFLYSVFLRFALRV